MMNRSTISTRAGLARVLAVLVAALTLTSAPAHAQNNDALQIYLVDVEGGNATLFVSPEGGSLLIDTGNGGANADRAASSDAGQGVGGLRELLALRRRTPLSLFRSVRESRVASPTQPPLATLRNPAIIHFYGL